VTTGKNRAISQARAARIHDSKRPQDQKLYVERLRDSLKFLSYAPYSSFLPPPVRMSTKFSP